MISRHQKKSFFYFFGIIYSAIIITIGSPVISIIELAFTCIVVILKAAVTVVRYFCPLLLAAGCLFLLNWLLPAAITPLIIAAISPILVSMTPAVLSILLGVGLLFVGYRLALDLLIGIPNSAVAFYSHHLYKHGIVRALFSPLVYLCERVLGQVVYGMNSYLTHKKQETLLTSYVYYINDVIKVSQYPREVANIIYDYAYAELVEINKKLMLPVWWTQQITFIENLPFEKSFFERVMQWAEKKYEISYFPSSSLSEGVDKEQAERFFSFFLRSHGFIRRKLVFMQESKDDALLEDKAHVEGTIYCWGLTRKITSSRMRDSIIQQEVIKYSDSPVYTAELPEILFFEKKQTIDQKPEAKLVADGKSEIASLEEKKSGAELVADQKSEAKLVIDGKSEIESPEEPKSGAELVATEIESPEEQKSGAGLVPTVIESLEEPKSRVEFVADQKAEAELISITEEKEKSGEFFFTSRTAILQKLFFDGGFPTFYKPKSQKPASVLTSTSQPSQQLQG